MFDATLEMIPLLKNRHKAEVIGAEMEKVINDVGWDKCVAVVTDSASNASSFDAEKIKCGCHQLNLIVGNNAIGNCLTQAQVQIKTSLLKEALESDAAAEEEALYNVDPEENEDEGAQQQQNKKRTKQDSYVREIFPLLHAIRFIIDIKVPFFPPSLGVIYEVHSV